MTNIKLEWYRKENSPGICFNIRYVVLSWDIVNSRNHVIGSLNCRIAWKFDWAFGSCLSMHYNDVIMSAIASQITSLAIVYSTVYSGTDQIKHQSSASLAFVRGIHRWPVNSPHKGPVTPKMFPFDDVIIYAFFPESGLTVTNQYVAWLSERHPNQVHLTMPVGAPCWREWLPLKVALEAWHPMRIQGKRQSQYRQDT